MNLWRVRRWESRRARRGAGWLMLLTVLALCLITLSRGGRAQPPPLKGKTVGDLLQRVAAAPGSSPVSSASPAFPTSHPRHPVTISFGNQGISVISRPVPAVAASPETSSDVTPAVAATPEPTPAVAASPEPTPAVAASPQPTPAVAASPEPAPAVAASPETTPTAAPAPDATPRAEASRAWNPEEPGGNSSAFIGKLQQMVIMLFLIGFLAFASLKALGRYLPGMAAPGKRIKQLEVLERQALAQGATVSLVRVGKRYLVVGQTEQNVNTLCELTSDQLSEQPETAPEKPAPPVASMSFHGDILRHYLSIFPGFGPGRKGDA